LTLTKQFVNNRFMPLKPPRPTEGELAILRVLWEGGPATVREILHTLNQTKPTGYTTALKLLQIMTEKELVQRDEQVRPQVYRPSCSQEQTQRQLVGDLLHRAFGGSVRTLVMQALAEKRSSPEELAAMEKLLDRFEGGKK
jgi:BlaI family transcriptional regulator, penicillinase repressor